ncbi:hypothetical protein NSPZN2_40475 [Nitrospira defluvii]|uniref:PIN domain-containing protein n=1 Tax=Nitrospira defluvii TaxID=330214 RepID=A0ABM8RWD3_9BACT|nr:hypothetical protein NSPZN2_40475 [Nitrospira defluvii]
MGSLSPVKLLLDTRILLWSVLEPDKLSMEVKAEPEHAHMLQQWDEFERRRKNGSLSQCGKGCGGGGAIASWRGWENTFLSTR